MRLFTVYVLENQATGKRYIGFTSDFKKRLEAHRSGHGGMTTRKGGYEPIYWEVCRNEEDARRREKYLKSANGMRFLAQRLKAYYGRT